MSDLYCVYKHTTPNGKVYIGQTKTGVENRWKNGKGYTCHRHGFFWKAIEKYGWDSIEHEVLYSDLTKEFADYYEQYFIEIYKSTDKRYGYNCQSGGSRNYKYTRASKENISNGLKKRYREKGFPKASLDVLNKNRAKQARRIVQYDLDGHIIAEYNSAFEASKCTGISNQKINQVVRDPKRNRQTGGYMWRYKEEATDKIEPYINKRPCNQYDIKGNFIKQWNDVKEADKSFSRDSKRNNIEKCCDGTGYKTAYGYMWKYSDEAGENIEPLQIGKPILQFDNNGNFIKRWNNSNEIQNALGWNVKNTCEHRNKTSFGYQWRYEGDDTPLIKVEKPHIVKKRIRQYKDGALVAEYETTKIASIKTGINASNIQCCASGRNKTAGGYQWKYVV